jgi:hypothetical protein
MQRSPLTLLAATALGVLLLTAAALALGPQAPCLRWLACVCKQCCVTRSLILMCSALREARLAGPWLLYSLEELYGTEQLLVQSVLYSY